MLCVCTYVCMYVYPIASDVVCQGSSVQCVTGGAHCVHTRPTDDSRRFIILPYPTLSLLGNEANPSLHTLLHCVGTPGHKLIISRVHENLLLPSQNT